MEAKEVCTEGELGVKAKSAGAPGKETPAPRVRMVTG